MRSYPALLPATVALLMTSFALGEEKPKEGVYIDPTKTDEDFGLQGEYAGPLGEDEEQFGVQVIALGGGEFEAVTCKGGLPGAGWDGERPRVRTRGKRTAEGKVEFKAETGFAGTLGTGSIQVFDPEGKLIGELPRVDRYSPTLGAEPPEGAIVLFDGKSKGAFSNGTVTEEGLLCEGAVCDRGLGDHTLHLEFRTPYKPKARGQGRGNSGLYLQGRYEVQILDSFGLSGKDNECGGIYKTATPPVNMCFPPLTWQTYDIEFTAARFDESGKKTANARATIKHNGVVIHKDVELPKPTTASRTKDESPEHTPFYVQNHGNPVRFKNIWAVEKK